MIEKLKNKLKEPSTKAGLVTLAALAGYSVTPEQVNAIIWVVLGGVAIYETIRKEIKG